MNRYDPEVQRLLLAERGGMRGRIVRGVLWALFAIFVFSVLANLLRYTAIGIDTFDITRLI